MKHNITFLVSSCDKYRDAWHPFFELLHQHAGPLDYPIVLNTETEQYNSVHFHIRTINTPQPMTWSQRMMQVLSQIDTELVFLLLEDFFLLDTFDEEQFLRVVQYMLDNPDIGYVNISSPHRIQPDNHNFLYIRDFNENIRGVNSCWMGVNATIWRRSYFQQILRPHENIWEFEGYSGYRARNMPYAIANINEKNPPIYPYEWVPEAGYGIYQGKWLSKNPELFAKYGIEVDYSRLGFFTETVPAPTRKEKILRLLRRTILRPYYKIRYEYRKYKSMH